MWNLLAEDTESAFKIIVSVVTVGFVLIMVCCAYSGSSRNRKLQPEDDDSDANSSMNKTNNASITNKSTKREKPLQTLLKSYTKLYAFEYRTDQEELDLAADIETDMQYVSEKLNTLHQAVSQHTAHLSHKADYAVLQHKQRRIEAQYALSYDLSSSDDSGNEMTHSHNNESQSGGESEHTDNSPHQYLENYNTALELEQQMLATDAAVTTNSLNNTEIDAIEYDLESLSVVFAEHKAERANSEDF